MVGAGIGGLTTALALSRVEWRVTVLERAPELGEVGAGLSIWPRAWKILADLGVVDRLVDGTRPAIQAGLRRPDGRWLAKVGADAAERTPVMVHRARLHEALVSELETRDGIEVRTGVTVTCLADLDDIEDIDGRGPADVVVAADGIRSTIRNELHQREDVRYAGYTAYRGVTAEPLPGDASTTGGETWGTGVRVGYVPLVDGRTYWFVTANRPEGETGTDHHADVTALVGDWHDPIPQLLAATPPSAVLRGDICDLRLPLKRFDHGRVVLLGRRARDDPQPRPGRLRRHRGRRRSGRAARRACSRRECAGGVRPDPAARDLSAGAGLPARRRARPGRQRSRGGGP